MVSFKIFIIAALSIAALSAQRLTLGILGGGSLTDSFPTTTTPAFFDVPNAPVGIRSFSSIDYIIGLSVEWQIPSHWSIEADGLYRKLHYTWAAVLPDGSLNSISPSPVVTWEFPVLAKYRFRVLNTQPFAELGPSFRSSGNLNGTQPSDAGVTAGFGVELRTRVMNIAPVLRYTRWDEDPVATGRPKSGQNQLELLLGLSHGVQSDWHPLSSRFSVGVQLGTNLAAPFAGYSSSSILSGQNLIENSTETLVSNPIKSLIAGAMIELALPRSFSLEADALYHPLRTQLQATVNGMKGDVETSSIATWELPVLAKYRFSTRVLTPFLEAGPSFRLPVQNLSNYGLLAGAGVETQVRRLKIAPSLRYIRWAADHYPSTTNRVNQLELMTGFSF